MNRYPAWKYVVIAAALLIGLLYALPNLFPEVPAVQVSTSKAGVKIDSTMLATVESALKAANIDYRGEVLDATGIKMRFNDANAQGKAKELLQAKLNPDPKDPDYIVALNLQSASPQWLASIGALPMYLGLDLRGGVHFLLQVDMKGALEKSADRYTADIRTLMRSEKIQYAGVTREGGNVIMRFRDNNAERVKARLLIDKNYPDLTEREVDTAPDDLRLYATLRPEALKRIQDGAVQQNIQILRNRVNELGVAEPIVQQQGSDRIVVQLPGVQDTARAKDILGRTATLEIRMANDDPGVLEAAMNGNVPIGSDLYKDRNGIPSVIRRQAVLTGDRIQDAQPGFDSRNNQPIVSVTLDASGGRIIRDISRENLKKRMGILLVEKNKTELITAPTIQEELGSRFQISGQMSARETKDIALLMRAGALAAPMEIVEERTVGPSLGAENITKGFDSVKHGFIVLAVFICAYYMLMGAISTLSLAINLLLLVAVLSMIQATLTLPGIAAIALTLGMAIDANVLINERIREELRWGATPHAAIQAGYERAWGTILDSNVTTLIAGIALLIFGSGPVRGFAVVHCLGIMTSMFSAVFISRGVVNLIYGNRKKLDKISIGQVWRPSATASAAVPAKKHAV